MRDKEVIRVLETRRNDACKFEREALNQAIDAVKTVHKLKKWMKSIEKEEREKPYIYVNTIDEFGFNPYQE